LHGLAARQGGRASLEQIFGGYAALGLFKAA
jgi:hypothetical protein